MSKVLFGDELSKEAQELIEKNIVNLRSEGGRKVIRELIDKRGEIVTTLQLCEVSGMKPAAVCSTVSKARDRGFIIVNYAASGQPSQYQITGAYEVERVGRTYNRTEGKRFTGLLNSVFGQMA